MEMNNKEETIRSLKSTEGKLQKEKDEQKEKYWRRRIVC